ncbi:MAG: WYL domain-containing protein [Actinomycetota bacterium]
MQRLERLFAINEALRRAAPGRLSTARLAEEFEVSQRTIERDIAALKAAGVPLYAERGRHGGQVSLDRAGSVVVTLSAAEVLALLVAVDVAGPDTPFADAGAAAANRLLDGLPSATRLSAEELRNRVRTRVPADGAVSPRVRRTVESGVRRRQVLNLHYADGDGAVTRRAVDPVGFHHNGDHWYLIGWCHLRRDGRLFRLDRIRRATITRTAAAAHDLDETLGWLPHDIRRP